MLIKRKSLLTGVDHEMELPITQAQIDDWKGGTLIQSAMPELEPFQREFMISGATEEEWKEHFGKWEE